uniref:Uncharacterized protein n=1 Tax=Anopheles coluzzii TaxID=1518534 RepID=A0A8W7PS41_ANOCL
MSSGHSCGAIEAGASQYFGSSPQTLPEMRPPGPDSPGDHFFHVAIVFSRDEHLSRPVLHTEPDRTEAVADQRQDHHHDLHRVDPVGEERPIVVPLVEQLNVGRRKATRPLVLCAQPPPRNALHQEAQPAANDRRYGGFPLRPYQIHVPALPVLGGGVVRVGTLPPAQLRFPLVLALGGQYVGPVGRWQRCARLMPMMMVMVMVVRMVMRPAIPRMTRPNQDLAPIVIVAQRAEPAAGEPPLPVLPLGPLVLLVLDRHAEEFGRLAPHVLLGALLARQIALRDAQQLRIAAALQRGSGRIVQRSGGVLRRWR